MSEGQSARMALEKLDAALLVTGPPLSTLLLQLIHLIEELILSDEPSAPKRAKTEPKSFPEPKIDSSHAVREMPAGRTAARKWWEREPMVWRGAVNEWPALLRWSPLRLRQRYGHRSVPVEVGESYAAAQWTQRVMTLGDFVDRHIFGDGPVGYVAQTQLFDLIPQLRNGI